MAELGRREEIVDPLALNPREKGPDRSLSTNGVRNPGQSAGNAATKQGMSVLQALDGIQATVGKVFEQQGEELRTNGILANMRGEAESTQNTKQGRQGWQANEAGTKAQTWFATQADFITNGAGKSMEPAEYQKYIQKQNADNLANLPEDPVSRKMWVENFKGFGPRLMGMQVEQNTKYNEERGSSALFSTLVTGSPVYEDASTPTAAGGGAFRINSAPVRQPVDTSDDEDEAAIRTLLGEAGAEGENGMAAVANVIMNRVGSGRFPNNVMGVVKEPQQFSTWNTGEGGNNPQKFAPGTPAWERAERVWQATKQGYVVDQTGGATHYTRSDMKAYWWDEESKGKDTVIGNHKFASHTGPEGSVETTAVAASAGALSFDHKGQDALDPAFNTLLINTSSATGKRLRITSGYRDANHPVEAAKETPGQHSDRTAADIDMEGMNDQERTNLVQTLRANGAKRFGTYDKHPNMLHVDMSTANGESWFMHNTSNKNIKQAPAWFQAVSGQPVPPASAVPQARTTGSQVQRMIVNSPLAATAKAAAVSRAMVQTLDAGDDTLFNDAGGMSVLHGLGATAEQIAKVYGAQQRYQEKKDKEYDLGTETARSELLTRVQNGDFSTAADALIAADDFNKKYIKTEAGQQSLARLVDAEWRKAQKEGDAIIPIPMRTHAAKLKENMELRLITPEEASQGITDMGKRLGVKASVINNFVTGLFAAEEQIKNKLEAEVTSKFEQQSKDKMTANSIQNALSQNAGLKGMDGTLEIPDQSPGNEGKVRRVPAEEAGIFLLKKAVSNDINPVLGQTMADPNATPTQITEAKAKAEKDFYDIVYEKLNKQGVYDKEFGRQISSSVTGSLIDPETKKVSGSALNAFGVYVQLRNNPRVGDEYVAGMIEDPQSRILLENAANLYNGQYKPDEALLTASTRLQEVNDPERKLEKTSAYTKTIKDEISKVLPSLAGTDGFFARFTDPARAAQAARLTDLGTAQAYIYSQASTYFLINKNIPPETAAKMAAADLKRNSVVVGSDLIIGNEQAGTRLDQSMGLTSMGRTAPHDAVMDYLQDFAGNKDKWGALWDERKGGWGLASFKDAKPGTDKAPPVVPLTITQKAPDISVRYDRVSGTLELALYKDASKTETVGTPIRVDAKILGDRWRAKNKDGMATGGQLSKSWRDFVDWRVDAAQEKDQAIQFQNSAEEIGRMAK